MDIITDKLQLLPQAAETDLDAVELTLIYVPRLEVWKNWKFPLPEDSPIKDWMWSDCWSKGMTIVMVSATRQILQVVPGNPYELKPKEERLCLQDAKDSI